MIKKRLAQWAGRPGLEQSEPVRLGLAQALYSPPNPDRTRKKCGNCVLWLPEREECFIHDAGVTATADTVCGYHVYGEPMVSPPPRENLQPVVPELSGLEQIPEGTSCDGCRYYQATPGVSSGICMALYEDEVDGAGDPIHAVVQALGCCAAWETSEE